MAAIIRYGMVGGGMKALIGEVHRKALKFDNRVELVAGCFSSHADRNAEVGVEYGLDPARVYANYEEMAKAEAAREDGIDFVSVVTPTTPTTPSARRFWKPASTWCAKSRSALPWSRRRNLQSSAAKRACSLASPTPTRVT